MPLRPRLEPARDIGQHDDRWALIGPDGPVTYARLASRVAEVARDSTADITVAMLRTEAGRDPTTETSTT